MSSINGRNVILMSHNKLIEFNENEVFVDNRKVDELNGVTAKEYAYVEARKYYANFFSTHFENLVLLAGAGCSASIGKGSKKGKTREELWNSVKKETTDDALKKLCEKIKYDYPKTGYGDIEAILSKAEKAKDYKLGISRIIEKIKKHIVNVCSLELPDGAPHQTFIQKVTSRKLRDPRVKIFTLNYDSLFEQAAKSGFTVIDGFSYANPRSFNGVYFDYDFVIRENSRIEKEENYVARVIHIYKLHGSLDWEKQGDKIIKANEADVKDPLIIYPNFEKYEVSYAQPFFEMMLRFQETLRKENVMLLVLGFGFYDKHITAIIKEALTTNPSFRMAVVTKNLTRIIDFENLKNSVSRGNLILIDDTFEEFSKAYPYPKIYQSDFLKVDLKNVRESADEK